MTRFILLFVALLWGLPAMAQSGLPDGTQGLACLATANPVVANSEGFWGRAVCDLKGQLYVNGTASGGSSGPSQTASNATDGQATSTTNQQNVVYNYIWNGSSWDRVRGTGGAVSTASTQLPASLGAKPSANSFSVAPATDATFAVTGAFYQATQPVSEANGANVVLGSQADAANANTVLGQLKQSNVNLLAPTPTGTNSIGTVGLNTGTNSIGSLNNISGTISLPTGAATAANQTTEITALQAIQLRSAIYSDGVNQSVAASANFGGASRDSGTAGQWTKFNVFAKSSLAGTLSIDGSNDNFTTPVNIQTISLTAGTGAQVPIPVTFRYYRAIVNNGSTTTAATVTLTESYVAN